MIIPVELLQFDSTVACFILAEYLLSLSGGLPHLQIRLPVIQVRY